MAEDETEIINEYCWSCDNTQEHERTSYHTVSGSVFSKTVCSNCGYETKDHHSE